MPWYLMSCKNQLSYVHILNRVQNGAILQIGPFAELNNETFSNARNYHLFLYNFITNSFFSDV